MLSNTFFFYRLLSLPYVFLCNLNQCHHICFVLKNQDGKMRTRKKPRRGGSKGPRRESNKCRKKLRKIRYPNCFIHNYILNKQPFSHPHPILAGKKKNSFCKIARKLVKQSDLIFLDSGLVFNIPMMQCVMSECSLFTLCKGHVML